MKKTILILAITLGAFVTLAGPWVPISVNTNTWECKPSGATFTNYWDNIGTNAPAPPTPTTPTSTPPISVSSPYANAGMWWSFYADNGDDTAIIDDSSNNTRGLEVSYDDITIYQPQWDDYAVKCQTFGKTGIETVSQNIVEGSGAFTISAWIRPDGAPNAAALVLHLPSDGSHIMELQYTFGDGILYTPWGRTTPESDIALTNDVWTHIAFNYYTGGAYAYYLNGTLTAAQGLAVGVADTEGAFTIGAWTNTVLGNYSYDDVAIWDRYLSGTEINTIYTNGRSTNALWYSESEW